MVHAGRLICRLMRAFIGASSAECHWSALQFMRLDANPTLRLQLLPQGTSTTIYAFHRANHRRRPVQKMEFFSTRLPEQLDLVPKHSAQRRQYGEEIPPWTARRRKAGVNLGHSDN